MERNSLGQNNDSLDLLSLPNPEEIEFSEESLSQIQSKFPTKLSRPVVSYKNASQKFIVTQKNFRQYYEIYSKRLEILKKFIVENATKKWKKVPIMSKISDSTVSGELCVIVGTIFKEMPLISRILKEFTSERALIPQPPRQSYISKEDRVLLEDESGRILLSGNMIQKDVVVTGIILGLKGKALASGEFEVEDICLPEFAPQPALKQDISNSSYVALISGMNIGETGQNPLALQLLTDFIVGHLGGSGDQSIASQICRVIVAGNSVCTFENQREGTSIFKKETLTGKSIHILVDPLKELDLILTQLSSSVHVDLMPGTTDPANFSLPQQPLNMSMLPCVRRYSTFQSVCNPYECEIEGRIFLGTSGCTIDNMEKYMIIENKLDLMEQTLKWRHIAPVAPDQLSTYPFSDRDPFIIDRCPHVYFIGNQSEFQTKKIRGTEGQTVTLIRVPDFSKTQTIVLVNLKTFHVHPITFDCSI